eukprot:scpid106813/ scgid20255/ 
MRCSVRMDGGEVGSVDRPATGLRQHRLPQTHCNGCARAPGPSCTQSFAGSRMLPGTEVFGTHARTHGAAQTSYLTQCTCVHLLHPARLSEIGIRILRTVVQDRYFNFNKTHGRVEVGAYQYQVCWQG